jgi:hypothetical protein
MRPAAFRVLLPALALVAAAFAPAVRAAPVPVKIDLPALRPIQLNNMDPDGEDDVYLVVSGVAKGEEINKRLPETGTMKVAPKKPAFTPEQPGVLWEGQLDDGEFAYVTVVLMQGEGKDEAKLKEFTGKLDAAAKKVEARSKKKIEGSSEDADKLVEQTLAGQREVVTHVKDTFAREKKTDHFGGLFNVLVWNNGGKITKRLDPVGLTFGEHHGIDAKIYTKLKYTRPNVLEKDEAGDWNEVQFAPVDDEDAVVVRVKMLETEYVKGDNDAMTRKVTDYLTDVRVQADGKPLEWELGGEQTGPGTLHTYWEYAE